MNTDKQAVEEKHALSESIYMSGHGLDWEDSDDVAEQLYTEGYRRQSEWISVEDRLPKDNVPVLVYKNKYSEVYGNMETAYIHNGIWRGSIGEAITHWMPLPEPPKMKGGAE